LGVIGLLMSIAGQIAIIEGDLAPRWYGWALIILAVPTAGFGGWLYARRNNCIANDRTGREDALRSGSWRLPSFQWRMLEGNELATVPREIVDSRSLAHPSGFEPEASTFRAI
jgi:hypothetical protein